MLAAAGMQLLPAFWQRLQPSSLPTSPWLLPLSYGALTMESKLEVALDQKGNPRLEEQRFELRYPAVPVDPDERAKLPATLVQGIPPCEGLIPRSCSTIGEHIKHHREKLAREHSERQPERKLLLAACLAELQREKEYREAIQLSLEALETVHDPHDFAPLGIGSEALRVVFDLAMTAGDDDTLVKALQVWDALQSRSSGRCSSILCTNISGSPCVNLTVHELGTGDEL